MEEVIFHPEARAELINAIAYYEECHSELGQQFLTAVESVITLIRLYPKAGRVFSSHYRRFLVAGFPYGIIYRETNNTIYIVAVMHLKRRPEYWLERVKDHQ